MAQLARARRPSLYFLLVFYLNGFDILEVGPLIKLAFVFKCTNVIIWLSFSCLYL